MTDLIKLDCPNCHTKYNISPEKVPKQGSIKLNCKKCGTSFKYSVSDEMAKRGGEDAGALKNSNGEITNKTMIGHTFLDEGNFETGSAPKESKITLTYKVNDEKIEKIIDKRLTIIGRTEGDIIINDSLISRKHTSIEIKSPTMIELKDLASTNGVFHNGMKVNSVFLQSGDEIKIGSTIIHFSSEIKFT